MATKEEVELAEREYRDSIMSHEDEYHMSLAIDRREAESWFRFYADSRGWTREQFFGG